MTLHLTVTCDGHRAGNPCTTTTSQPAADVAKLATDWRALPDDSGDLCPNPGHDEDPQPSTPSPRSLALDRGKATP